MADTNIKTNRRILRVLLTIQNRAIDLESQLRVDRKANEADQLGLGIDKLEFMIRVLRAKILDNWAAKVPDLRKKLGYVCVKCWSPPMAWARNTEGVRVSAKDSKHLRHPR